MKSNKSFALSLFVALFALFNFSVSAQDDVFYDPDSDSPVVTETYESNNVTQKYDGDGDYDDEYYSEDEDEYAYEYSSRIRRFHRNRVVVYDYYDPFYTDMYYYDPFFSPGASIYVMNYNDYWRWRRWNRHHWNDWGWGSPYSGGYNSWCGWNSWGYNSWGGWGSWNNTYVYNNYYYDPYWTCNGYNPYYCHGNTWSSNNYYYNNSNNHNGGYQPATYTGGGRRTGTRVNPGYARVPGGTRLTTAEKAPTVAEKFGTRPGGRIITSDVEPAPSKATRSTRPNNPTGTVESQNGRTPRTEKPSPETSPSRRQETSPAEPRQPRTEMPAPVERPRRNEVERTRPTETSPAPERPRKNEVERPRNEEPRPSRRQETAPSRSEERPSRRAESSGDNGGSSRRWESTPSPTRSERSSSGSESRPSRSETRSSDSPKSSGSERSSSGSSRSNSGGGGRRGN